MYLFNFKKKFYIKHYVVYILLTYNSTNIYYMFKKKYIHFSINRFFLKRIFNNILIKILHKFYGYNIWFIHSRFFCNNKYFVIFKYKYINFYYEIFFLLNKLLFYLK